MHSNLRKQPKNEILTIIYARYRNYCNNVLKKEYKKITNTRKIIKDVANLHKRKY